MKFVLRYHDKVVDEDIPALPFVWSEKIKIAIEVRLTSDPDLYGKPLRRSLAGYRKLRVGDYRIIFRIEGQAVKIFIIDHRSRVYENIFGRL